MKIKIKYHNKNCKIESFGNWIDLKSAENVEMNVSDHKLISLGVSMKLPKYFQANVVPRSSTYMKFGIIQANHTGIIDGPDKTSNGYSGNDDIWKFSAIALKEHHNEYRIVDGERIYQGEYRVMEGDRICQFEIRPTMFAPWWVKIKWIFDNKIQFIEVDDLKSDNRGGFGSTKK